jgi:hypothetical protein
MQQHVHEHMNMQHGNGLAASTWACSMEMGVQHGYGHVLGHVAWTWTCSMDKDMQPGRGHGQAECTVLAHVVVHV